MSINVRVNIAPPPLPYYEQPIIPAKGYLWVPGFWAWDESQADYYWVPGTWVVPPRRGLLWTPGYWGWVEGRYVFHSGYWAREVGFYGGIDYGYGYFGEGYQGGRWDNGVFFYNRSVNNVANVRITNVYNQTVVGSKTSNNVSFNGGKGGITARPTRQQEAVAEERHVEATPVQRRHVETASKDRALFSKQNHGKPSVAATPRAGVLKGAGISSGSLTPVGANAPKTGREKSGTEVKKEAPKVDEKHSPAQAPPKAGEQRRPAQEQRAKEMSKEAPKAEARRRPAQERPNADVQRRPAQEPRAREMNREAPKAEARRRPAQEWPNADVQRRPAQEPRAREMNREAPKAEERRRPAQERPIAHEQRRPAQEPRAREMNREAPKAEERRRPAQERPNAGEQQRPVQEPRASETRQAPRAERIPERPARSQSPRSPGEEKKGN